MTTTKNASKIRKKIHSVYYVHTIGILCLSKNQEKKVIVLYYVSICTVRVSLFLVYCIILFNQLVSAMKSVCDAG